MNLVTILRTFNPAEAQVLASRLDAAEIPATVIHETAALTMEGYSLAAGGVLVQVPEEFVESASALLAESSKDPA